MLRQQQNIQHHVIIYVQIKPIQLNRMHNLFLYTKSKNIDEV